MVISSSATQPCGQKATFQPFQCVRHEAVWPLSVYFNHCTHVVRRLLFSHFSVYDKSSCDRYSAIQLLNRVIKRLLLSHFNVGDKRSNDHYSATQPYDQEATFQPFQCLR